MNKTLVISLAVAIGMVCTIGANQVLATEASPSAKLALQETNKVNRLQTQAANEIDRRLNSLSKLTGLINSAKKLSTDDKNTLDLQIQSQISSLMTLKTKVSTDSASLDLKTDVDSIKSSYRIYALYLPKMHILVAADLLNQVADKLTTLSLKLQSRIQQADTAGQDVTQLQSKLTDLQTHIADLTTQTTEATSSVLPLTPDGWPANKSTLTAARTNLVNARKDAGTAKADIQQILADLKSLRPKTSTDSASPSASASSSAAMTH